MSKKVLVENRENQTEHMRMYYEHQYDRIAKLEDRRLAMTHIVITLSVITFTFGFANPKDLTVITGLGLPVIMLISNLLVITYINRTSQHIAVHQRRAKQMLKLYASEIYGIDKSMPMPRQWDWLRTANMQFTFHVLLMIATLLPVALYLLRVYYGIRF